MLVGLRERAVAAQTQIGNTIRGYAAEFGLTAAKGMSHIPLLLERMAVDDNIPGVGPIGAVLLVMKAPAPEQFTSGRQFAAWMGLTPKDHSTAGKVRLGVITRAGDEALRKTLIVGATSSLRQVRAGRGRNASSWLIELLKRKPPKLAAVALANKIARIAWKMMVTGEVYKGNAARPAMACAA